MKKPFIFDGKEYDEATLPMLASFHLQKAREITAALNQATAEFVKAKIMVEALSALLGQSESVIRKELAFDADSRQIKYIDPENPPKPVDAGHIFVINHETPDKQSAA